MTLLRDYRPPSHRRKASSITKHSTHSFRAKCPISSTHTSQHCPLQEQHRPLQQKQPNNKTGPTTKAAKQQNRQNNKSTQQQKQPNNKSGPTTKAAQRALRTQTNTVHCYDSSSHGSRKIRVLLEGRDLQMVETSLSIEAA